MGNVTLTKTEQALYLNQRNIVEGVRNQEGQMKRVAEERLLKLCTHFDPDGERNDGAADAVTATKARQQEQLERAEVGIRECEALMHLALGLRTHPFHARSPAVRMTN